MRVPLVDLGWQHEVIAKDVDYGLSQLFANTAFIHGPQVGEFEVSFARFVGTKHCIGVGSGTDALELSLRALDLGPGDAVIVPANSFIASALGALRAGLGVMLVDCDPTTHLLDMEKASDAIDPSVRAIMPVHLYGQMAPIDLLPEIPEHVTIIEDAAQSHGATRHGKGMGSFGAIAATSFYPGKNLGAYGDAGAVVTNRDDLADRVRKMGNWGSAEKYHHPELGFNSRLDTLQAIVLSAKLARLNHWNEARRKAANLYREMLADLEQVELPKTLDGNEHVWHLFVIRVPDRDEILRGLLDRGIGAGIHYPVPMHLQGALAELGYGPGDFPNAEKAASEILSLPIYPGITESQQEEVASALRDSLRSN